MKKIFALIALVFCAFTAMSQNLQEIVYLKNGSVIKGLIIEQVPNTSIKIKTNDGNIFVFNVEEIEKITKEVVPYNQDRGETKMYGSTETNTDYEKHGWEKAPRYRGFIGEGYGFGVEEYDKGMEIYTSHGVQINPFLYAGVGIAANYYSGLYDWSDSGWSVPVFVNVRSEFHKSFRRNFSPYVDFKIGYSVAGDFDGVYVHPEIGIHFYFGHSITGVSIGLGYTYQEAKRDSYYWQYSDKFNFSGVSLMCAFDF